MAEMIPNPSAANTIPPRNTVPPVNTIPVNSSSQFRSMEFLAMSSTLLVSFSHAISFRLSETNFLLWKQQVEPIIHGHRLHRLARNN